MFILCNGKFEKILLKGLLLWNMSEKNQSEEQRQKFQIEISHWFRQM